jgi:hypothetical protein
MPPDTVTIAIGALSAGTALSLAVYTVKASMWMGSIQTKVDTMWAFQMRRAVSEIASSGVGTVNSPITFTQDARSAMNPLKDELIAFNAGIEKKSDAEALLEIERVFGDRLLKLVCLPCGLSHGACLLLALAVARQTELLSLSLH